MPRSIFGVRPGRGACAPDPGLNAREELTTQMSEEVPVHVHKLSLARRQVNVPLSPSGSFACARGRGLARLLSPHDLEPRIEIRIAHLDQPAPVLVVERFGLAAHRH